MSALDQPQLGRLADLTKSRRAQLGMTADRVASLAGVTPKTYSRIESGKPVRTITYGKIEPVLGWAYGSCSDVLTGGSPALVEPTAVNGALISPVTPADLEADVSQAVQLAAIALDDVDLSASDIRALKHQVVQELRRRGHLTDPDHE